MPKLSNEISYWRIIAQRWLPPLIWAYFTCLFGWLFAYILIADRHGHLALINQLGVYLFFPLSIVLVAAVLLRRREIWVGLGVGVLVFLGLWGELFFPRSFATVDNEGKLRVMTYNTLGFNMDPAPAIDVILETDADVVLIQEVNFPLAEALADQLLDIYPYQIMDPNNNVIGIGAISKYPLRLTDISLPLNWVGVPQVLELDWQGRSIRLVNFHMWAAGLAPEDMIRSVIIHRIAQAEALVDFARQTEGPVIFAGDANVTSLSEEYRIITAELNDAWAEAGFGLGHTFPGSTIPGSSRTRIGDWWVPQWLVRIDYVFYSEHWIALKAELAPFDGLSDHRGVVVDLGLID